MEVEEKNLASLFEANLLEECFKKYNIYSSYDNFRQRFNKIIYDALSSSPTIADFNSTLSYFADCEWKRHKDFNREFHTNIFGKICSALRFYNDFEVALSTLNFIDDIKYVLDLRYYDLFLAMKEYFDIYHSDDEKKLEKIKDSKDIISKMSALYISKSKEAFKKDKMDRYHETLRDYFTLKLEQPFVKKKIVQAKQKDKFKELFISGDVEVIKYVNDLYNMFEKDVSREDYFCMINGFIKQNYSTLDNIFEEPYDYQEYLRYEKASKLINRLNLGNIKIDGPEAFNYMDLIDYDGKRYFYNGIDFDEESILMYLEYNRKKDIFNRIKKYIMLKVKELPVDNSIDIDMLEDLSFELPFNDEYFRFDLKRNLNEFKFIDLVPALSITLCSNSDNVVRYESFTDEAILSDSSYFSIYNLMVNKGLLWLKLIVDDSYGIDSIYINTKDLIHLMNNMPSITKVLDVKSFEDLKLGYKICNCSDEFTMSILGKDMIQKLIEEKSSSGYEDSDITSNAVALLCSMRTKTKSTVPYISGSTDNYKYSMYDSLSNDILTSGINTDACFRVCGVDNDFLHYCALDKNGFVIKITDSYGNFIGRASGFRNGNCVYINQLRTVYDAGSNTHFGEYQIEKKEIIEAFTKACEDIIKISQENPLEKDKIDFVFVTRSYFMSDVETNVSLDVTQTIGSKPMDTESEDWLYFVDKTLNLYETIIDGRFITDYGNYPLICMASSGKKIIKENILKYDAEAVYKRERNKPIITNKIDEEIKQKIKNVSYTIDFLNSTADFSNQALTLGEECNYEIEISEPMIPEDECMAFLGDNWYIIIQDGYLYDWAIIDKDEDAVLEFNNYIDALSLREQYEIDTCEDIDEDELIEKRDKMLNDILGDKVKKIKY